MLMVNQLVGFGAGGRDVVAYRYIRLEAAGPSHNAGAGSHVQVMVEAEMFDAPDATGTDLTTGLGASCSATGYYSSGGDDRPPSKAVDNNTSGPSDSWTTPIPSTSIQYWGIEFPAPTIVRSMRIMYFADGGGMYAPTSLLVRGSQDNGTYFTIATITPANGTTAGVWQTFTNLQ